VTWAGDNKTLFYATEDAAKRPYRLYRHTLGQPKNTLVYEEKDEMFRIFATRSRSQAYIFLTSASHTTSEVRYLRADQPNGAFKLIRPREPNHEYYADHHGDLFYLRTNDGARNFRLVSAPVKDPQAKNWKEVIPHRPDVMLEGMDFFAHHYVTQERENGLPQM